MAGIKGLVALAFAGSVGMTFIVLACALPNYGAWWPFVVVAFYLLAPVPTYIARRQTEIAGSQNSNMDIAIFFTMLFVVSSFALPVVLARSPPDNPAIKWGACYLTLAGNVVVFLTYIGFYTLCDDDHYRNWW